jgi:hypothetical protein
MPHSTVPRALLLLAVAVVALLGQAHAKPWWQDPAVWWYKPGNKNNCPSAYPGFPGAHVQPAASFARDPLRATPRLFINPSCFCLQSKFEPLIIVHLALAATVPALGVATPGSIPTDGACELAASACLAPHTSMVYYEVQKEIASEL